MILPPSPISFIVELFANISNNLSRINLTVDEEGKLVFTDSTGADSVIPFSSLKWATGTLRSTTYNETVYADVGFKPKYAFMMFPYTDGYYELMCFDNKKFDNQNRVYMAITDTGCSWTPHVYAAVSYTCYYFLATDEI